jgi:hypothetical protein
MARKTIDVLVDKSVHALIAAIEIYNKPDFKYREESFVILLLNSWELALKAKIITNNNGNKKSIYEKKFTVKLDGNKSKLWKYKTTTSGSFLTISITKCIANLAENNVLEKNVISNLEDLIEIRNASVHFFANSIDLVQRVHELGSASIFNLVNYFNIWFKYKLYPS